MILFPLQCLYFYNFPFIFQVWYSHVWIANFVRSEDYNYIEEAIQAGMVDRLVQGANFPYDSAVAAGYKAVSPDIHSGFTQFRYQ